MMKNTNEMELVFDSRPVNEDLRVCLLQHL